MNFCGGAVELQVHETPMVPLGQHHSSVDGDILHHQYQYHHHVDLPVHPSCMVKTSQPQNSSSPSKISSSSKTTVLRITKKKLQQPQQQQQQPRPRSRSRSDSRGRRKPTGTAEEGILRMDMNTPTRQTNSQSARSSPSPRMLNPLSPQRIVSENGPGLIGLPSFSNMKTLDTLLKRLENGFRVVCQTDVSFLLSLLV
jgi:hypothetical protein